MRDYRLIEEEVARAKQRHAERKLKSAWDPQNVKEAVADTDTILEELGRANAMIDSLRKQCGDLADQVRALSGRRMT